MNVKEQLDKYLQQYEQGFKDRTAIRYLCKRNEELWQQIVEKTSFLPADAKPKQRCWHIIKEYYKIPSCPVDNVPLKWMENKYAEFSSHSAVARCVEKTREKMETYKKRTGFDSWNGKCNPEGYVKFKKAWLKTWNNDDEKGDSND